MLNGPENIYLDWRQFGIVVALHVIGVKTRQY